MTGITSAPPETSHSCNQPCTLLMLSNTNGSTSSLAGLRHHTGCGALTHTHTHACTHTHTHTLSLSHTHTHTHTHTRTHAHTRTLSLSLSHTNTLSLSHTHTSLSKRGHSITLFYTQRVINIKSHKPSQKTFHLLF